MTITFKNLSTGESLEIKCKTWYPTAKGLVYMSYLNEWRHEFERYCVDTGWTFWEVR